MEQLRAVLVQKLDNTEKVFTALWKTFPELKNHEIDWETLWVYYDRLPNHHKIDESSFLHFHLWDNLNKKRQKFYRGIY